MQCPACSATLQMMERQGVEIDYCPQCRGVWLDRGELDKILERSNTLIGGAPAAGPRPPQAHPGERPYRDERPYGGDRDEHHYRHDPDHRHKRRKNWLEDLFD